MIEMKKVIVISSLLLAISFTAVAQIFGATQGGEQKAFGATAPSATFQSTSSMPGSGSEYSSNPTLNADGTAAYLGEANSSSKTNYQPRRAKKEGDENNPVITDGDNPIGDALIPLTLFAGAYLIIRATRRKVHSMMSERCK